MNGHNFTSAKSISLVSILVLSIISVGFLLPQVIADHGSDPGITKSLDAGISTIVSFRDTTNVLLQGATVDGIFISTTIVSVDTSTIKAGFFTIIVEEKDADLDASVNDGITATATSTSSGSDFATAFLTETTANSGEFTGTIQVILSGPTAGNVLQLGRGDEIFLDHESESIGVPRVSLEIDAINGGNVIISDELLDGDDFTNLGFRPASHAVKLEFPDTVTPHEIDSLTISCINALLEPGDDVGDLNIFFKPDNPLLPAQDKVGWFEFGSVPFTDPALNVVVAGDDPKRCIVTSDMTTSNWDTILDAVIASPFGMKGLPITEAQFLIGFDTGITGGGGGGIVRQGLVVNALVGVSSLSALFSGGAGDGPTNPTFGEGSMSVLGSGEQGFGGIISGGDENPFDTITVVKVGEKVTVRVPLYENQGINNIDEVVWYLNFAGENYDRSSIDTYILFDRGVVTVVDPHEKLESANIEILQEDGWNLIVIGDLVFKNTMTPSNFLFYSVDLDRNFGEILIPNVLEVIESSILLADEQKEIQPILQLTTTEDMTEVKLTKIPLWVKSNALWWQQKQIDDSDFIAGIEYLIQKAIINIDDQDISRTGISQDIPGWIQDVAGFWANDSMTDDEFIQAMQWLISKGIITVQT